MKFGAKLRAYAVPEWQGAYVRYDVLKALIKKYQVEVKAATKKAEQEEKRRQQSQQGLRSFDSGTSPAGYLLQRLLGSSHAADASLSVHVAEAARATTGHVALLPGRDEAVVAAREATAAAAAAATAAAAADPRRSELVQRVQQKAVKEFDALLEAEVEKVERHFWEKLRTVKQRLQAVEEELSLLVPKSRSKKKKIKAPVSPAGSRGPGHHHAGSSFAFLDHTWQPHLRSSSDSLLQEEQLKRRLLEGDGHSDRRSDPSYRRNGHIDIGDNHSDSRSGLSDGRNGPSGRSPVCRRAGERRTPACRIPEGYTSEKSNEEGEEEEEEVGSDSSAEGSEERVCPSSERSSTGAEQIHLHPSQSPWRRRRSTSSELEKSTHASRRANEGRDRDQAAACNCENDSSGRTRDQTTPCNRRHDYNGSERSTPASRRVSDWTAEDEAAAACRSAHHKTTSEPSWEDAKTGDKVSHIRRLRDPSENAEESHKLTGRDAEDVQYSSNDGNIRTPALSTATSRPKTSRRAGDAESSAAILKESDPAEDGGDYGPPLFYTNARGSLCTSYEQRKGTSLRQSFHAHDLADDEAFLDEGEDLLQSAERETHVAHVRRLQRVIISLLDVFEKLQGFANLNIICVYKILKKRDKKLGTQLLRGSFGFYEARLNALVIPKSLKTTVVTLYRRTCRAVGPEDGISADDTLHSFHRLQMAVQKDMLTRRATSLASQSRPLYFSLGCVATLFVNVLILASRKASNPNFRQETLIAYIPIYRFIFECSFATMACAMSMACMEAYGVNYKFLLDIDPKSQVDSLTIFGLASLQQLIFFFTFALFLLDYKFGVFGNHNMYWAYLPALIILQLLVLALPHPTFRLTYRKHILYTIIRVFRAGLLLTSDVTLLQNLVGDVLTSFSKPLGDLQYLVCFYATGLDHVAKPQCVGEGWIRPVLVGIPFYLRLCQCICRYRARKGDAQTQRLHLLNCGKYIAGILVIVCNSLPWQSFGVSPYSMCLIWVSSYICGTMYMFFWDVKVDWGLMPDPDHFLRPAGRRMYPLWMYQGIAVGNLIGRLTWATTLMPVSFSSLRSHLLNLVISVVEISRRAGWVVLRLENEHVSNSSKYRATLWVPPLFQKSAFDLVGEEEKPARIKTWPTRGTLIRRDSSSASSRRQDRENMVPSSPTQTSLESHFSGFPLSAEQSTDKNEACKKEPLTDGRENPGRFCSS